MRPLKITCRLASPLAGDPPYLDSVLEWAVQRRWKAILASSNGYRHDGIDSGVPGTIPIPVRRIRVDGFAHLLPLCSNPILPASSETVEHYARRIEVDAEYVRPSRLRVVDTQAGPLKASRLPLRIRPVDRIVWFAVGAPKEVRYRLKRFIPAIGKKVVLGYGRVAEWIVEFAEDDWSWFAPSEHGPVLMRVLPASIRFPDGLIGYRHWFGAPVGPYWSHANYCEVLMPC